MSCMLWVLLLPLSLPAGLSGQQVPITLEPLARIGCADCRGPELFAGIQDIAVSGEIVLIADRSAPFIRIFKASGQTLRAFAGAGDGPGELRLPMSVVPRPGGAAEVYDMRQQRFTAYDTAGGMLRTRKASDFLVVVSGAPGAGPLYALSTDFRSTSQPLLRIQGEKPQATITSLTAAFPKLGAGEHARTPAMAVSNRVIAVGDGVAEYRIRLFDTTGRALRDIVREIPKPKKTAAEIEQEREQLRRRAARMHAMARAENGSGPRRSEEPRPERNYFDMNALEFDERGRLWVLTTRGGLAATIFDLFGPDGGYLGQLRVPVRIGPYAVHDGILAGVIRDENEVEYVATWRVH